MKSLIGLHSLAVLLLTLVTFNSGFAQDEKKVAYGILLDNTLSLEKQFPQIKAVGKGVVGRTNQRGPISLFNFTTKRDQASRLAMVMPGVEWSQDENILNNYIDGISVVEGQTTLLEAIDSIAKELNAKVDANKESFGDKVIILITDGEDRISRVKGFGNEDDARRKAEEQLIKALKESAVKVYAIGFTTELNADGTFIRKSPKEIAETFLRKITKETGGSVMFFKPKKVDVESVLNELLAR